MKVALVRAKYNPFGGAERFVQTAIGALAAEGVSLTILTRRWPENATGADHVILNPRYVTSTGRDRGFAAAVAAHVQQQHYDLVQAHERIVGCDVFRAGDGVHAVWLKQRRRIASTLQRFGTALNPHHRYLLNTERAMFESPKLRAVICNSQMVRKEIAEHFDIDASKLRVILSGVDSAKFNIGLRDTLRDPQRRALSITDGTPVALFVGSGFARKGLAGFLDALAQPSNKMTTGVVVGQDKHMSRYRSLSAALGLSDRIRFAGGVDDVRPYYAAADIFVLPTLYDPLPNACLEAMACGLPTITSTGSGAAELIHDDHEGYVCDALDTKALGSAMARATESALSGNQMGLAAAERVADLTPQRMAGEYIRLYRELLGHQAVK
jgi:UDP-glucose:(heptosyl)LPS alpha-1,3-glucosyltransferase